MDETYSTQAIILNYQPFRERDVRVVAYSRERGKLELVARGARKIGSKLSGHLQPMSLAQIMVVRGRQFDYAGGADCLDSFARVKGDLDKIMAAGRAISIFDKAVKMNEPDYALFDLVCGYLRLLGGAADGRHDFYYHGFVFKLLATMGYKPELYVCVVCRRPAAPEGNHFSPDKGGIVCGRCHASLAGARKHPVSAPTIKTLRLLADLPVGDLVRLKTGEVPDRELTGIIPAFHAYHCG
jgi:DNA repair protein RecO (recombination protein O)